MKTCSVKRDLFEDEENLYNPKITNMEDIKQKV